MVDRLVNSEANARRIAVVEGCFGGEVLSAPNRVLVGEGVLQKQCRKELKPRQFFLFNDIIVYGTILIPKKKYKGLKVLPLDEVRIVSLEDTTPDRMNGWQIISLSKTFNVYAAHASEKHDWISHLNTCIASCQKRGRVHYDQDRVSTPSLFSTIAGDVARFVVTGVPQKGCFSSLNPLNRFECVTRVLLMRVLSRPANNVQTAAGKRPVIGSLLSKYLSLSLSHHYFSRKTKTPVLLSFSPERKSDTTHVATLEVAFACVPGRKYIYL
eukprot:sb/3468205/